MIDILTLSTIFFSHFFMVYIPICIVLYSIRRLRGTLKKPSTLSEQIRDMFF